MKILCFEFKFSCEYIGFSKKERLRKELLEPWQRKPKKISKKIKKGTIEVLKTKSFIDAIKYLRAKTNMGLKDAKEQVEEWRDVIQYKDKH